MASKNKTIVTGNNLELDVKNNIGDFNKIIGNTTQETTKGINKFNTARIETGTKYGVTCTYNSNDDSITFNGTCTKDNTVFQLPSENIIKGNSGKTRTIAYWLNGSATGTALVMLFNSNFSKGLFTDLTVLNSNKQTISASYGSSETQVDFINNRIKFNNGSVLNNFTIKVMVVEDGQTTETPYEKFTGGESSPNPDYPSKVETVTGSVEVKVSNKNLFTTANQILAYIGGSSFVLSDSSTSNDNYTAIIPIKPNTSYTISRSIISSRFRVGFYSTKNALGKTLRNGRTSDSATNMTVTSGENDYYLYLYYWTKNDTTSAEEIASTIQVEEGTTATDFIPHKQQTYPLYLPFELCKIGEYKDYIFKENNKWYKHKDIEKIILNGSEQWTLKNNDETNYCYSISSITNYKHATLSNYGFSNFFNVGRAYGFDDALSRGVGLWFYTATGSNVIYLVTNKATTVNDLKNWLSNNNTTVYYVLETPVDEEITDTTLIRQLNELENILLYNGINYISMEGNGTFEFQYGSKFDFYLSENNYLILNDTNKYLCSISESEIPDMPEAVDTTAKIAGRDGDIVLSTTYNPIPFNLVIYTEDNLSLQEKEEQKRIINQFWHEMKKQKKIFELESSQMFYEVKYNGLLECENHPKHLRFSLPFKSSRPYAYANEQKEMVGNSSINSDTIEPVGFECVIKGPANNPIIYFNNYEMKYNNIVPENSKLVIDTKNSTIVLKNALGVETNAMRHYNHQFPKIQRGINTLKVQSGIADESQVTIEWYDLKF